MFLPSAGLRSPSLFRVLRHQTDRERLNECCKEAYYVMPCERYRAYNFNEDISLTPMSWDTYGAELIVDEYCEVGCMY